VFPFAEGLEDLKIRRRLYRGYLIFFTDQEKRVEFCALSMARATGERCSKAKRVDRFTGKVKVAPFPCAGARSCKGRRRGRPLQTLTQGFCIIFRR
jgi:hypothetical protein